MTIAIVVHGGAWEIPDALAEIQTAGCAEAAGRGYGVLRDGGSALDAAEAAVRAFEDDPRFDSGLGSFLNRDGVPELDAGLMDGTTLLSGAVASVIGVRNPIALARRVLEAGTDRLVVGAGAVRLAGELGIATVDPEEMTTSGARAFWERHRARDPRAIFEPHAQGTVGAVALDGRGNVAAATSTGGLPGKRAGRVGDSPLIGSGFYADSESGGASATGHGEAIMTVGLTRFVVDRIRAGESVETAVTAAVAALASPRVGGAGGVIALDRDGRAAAAFNTSRMARAWIDGSGAEHSAVDP